MAMEISEVAAAVWTELDGRFALKDKKELEAFLQATCLGCFFFLHQTEGSPDHPLSSTSHFLRALHRINIKYEETLDSVLQV